jgi:hypothetical protein
VQPPFPPRPRPTPPGGGIQSGNPFAGAPAPPLNIPGTVAKPKPKSKAKPKAKAKAPAKKAAAKKK